MPRMSDMPRSRKLLFSREDYLAPPAVPTGQPPRDVLNTIWRKNEVFLDIGDYSIGSAVMVIWPVLMLALLIGWYTVEGLDLLYWGGVAGICGIPILFVLYGLIQPVPLPTRFTRLPLQLPAQHGRAHGMSATLTQSCDGAGSALAHRPFPVPFPARGYLPRQVIPRRWLFALLAGTLLLGGCSAREPEMLPAPVEGYNHTSAAINRFTVNGAGGPNLGPHTGGGSQVCCGALPRHWRPGLRAIVEWEKDPDPYGYAKWPEPMFSDAWQKRAKEHQTHYTRHSATVEIAPYRTPGDLIVHFLPCNQIRVASAEVTPGYPGYPYNYPLNMEEPSVCPQP